MSNAQSVINSKASLIYIIESTYSTRRRHQQHEEDDEKPNGSTAAASECSASDQRGPEGARHEQRARGREPSPEGGDQRGGTRIG